MFKAIVVNRSSNGYQAAIEEIDDTRLPHNDVQVDVAYSTLNYKDALAITGKAPIGRIWPLIPGIDLAGTVSACTNDRFAVGQEVLATGWGLGESHWGGLSQEASVKSEWLTPVPRGFSMKDAMAVGTAGFTAMLCVDALQREGVAPDGGDIIVTGASGGVGSIAIALLSALGYRVIASTGRLGESAYLTTLGAKEVVDRHTLSVPGKALGKARWAGAVDTVGSYTLANVCASMKESGTVAACGLAQGMDFPATVAPFILRGVKLIGINSVLCSQEVRSRTWGNLVKLLKRDTLDLIAATTVDLRDALNLAPRILEGKVRGRVIVALRP